jgi:hypothetical protein
MEDCTNTYYDPSIRPTFVLEEKKTCIDSSPSRNKNHTASPTKRTRVRFDCTGVSSAIEATACDTNDKEQIWYSRQEIKQCHREIVAIVKKRRQEATLRGASATELSFRGIEELVSKSAHQARRKRKRCVVENVLKEQARQTKLNIVDPDCLGRKSKLASKASRDLAFKRGSMDAYAAYTLF